MARNNKASQRKHTSNFRTFEKVPKNSIRHISDFSTCDIDFRTIKRLVFTLVLVNKGMIRWINSVNYEHISILIRVSCKKCKNMNNQR